MTRGALDSVLGILFKQGRLIATFSDGSSREFGDNTGEVVHIRFVTQRAERKMVLNPSLGPDPNKEVSVELRRHGFEYWKSAKRSLEKWRSTESGKILLVPHNLKSRHTENPILKVA